MNNSEILFLYDAKGCNPNGDMDNENKPRMDWDTDTNLVSDVRLKRYIRDYFDKYKGEEIFITDKAEKAKERGEQLKKEKKVHRDLIDVRMFGAVFAEEGSNEGLTGAVQFNWGYSLNRVELQESKTITSSFNSGEGIGKDYRVKYSFIAFSGGINALAGETTELKDDDIKLLDEAMVNAIPLNRTRSKIGQTPRLYLRVELKRKDLFLKDLREYIKLENKENLNDISNVQLDISELVKYLDKNKNKIEKIYYFVDDKLNIGTKIDEKFKNFTLINLEKQSSVEE